MRRFGLKTGVHFLPNLVSNRVWISTELRESMNVFIVSIPNEYERKSLYEFEMEFNKSLCWSSNLSNDGMISYRRLFKGWITIHQINLYPVDSAICFPNTNPLDSS